MAIQYDNERIITAAQMVSAVQTDIDLRSIGAMSAHPRADRFITNNLDVRLYYRFAPKAKGIDVGVNQYTSYIPAGSAAVIEADRWIGEIQLAAPGAATGHVVVSIARDV
ncbi:MAG: hypothetical protein ACRC62_11105 [Microcoleus sp.]